MILFLGALLGFISVAFGAFAEHALREVISAEQFRFVMTAIRYNQVNAVMICTLGLSLLQATGWPALGLLRWSARLFVISTLLFSGSIYLSVVLNSEGLLLLTPVGGVSLLIAWLLLLGFAFFVSYKRTH